VSESESSSWAGPSAVPDVMSAGAAQVSVAGLMTRVPIAAGGWGQAGLWPAQPPEGMPGQSVLAARPPGGDPSHVGLPQNLAALFNSALHRKRRQGTPIPLAPTLRRFLV